MGDWIKNLIAQLVGPSIIGQVVRGLIKVISGYLLSLGINSAAVDNFDKAATEILIAIVMALLAQKGSAIATKKALDTPAPPVIVKG
jgi:predicted membrane-bound spermidine synthase